LARVAVLHFRDYKTAFRFGQVGLQLVEGRGLKRFRTPIDFYFGAWIAPWMKHVRASIDLTRRALDTANKTGDFTLVNYANLVLNSALLVAGDPLSNVQHEAERGLAFVKNRRFSGVIDLAIPQLALIRTLRGLTAKFGCFDSDEFEEVPFERHVAGVFGGCGVLVLGPQAASAVLCR
jgi:hypothetical protein